MPEFRSWDEVEELEDGDGDGDGDVEGGSRVVLARMTGNPCEKSRSAVAIPRERHQGSIKGHDKKVDDGGSWKRTRTRMRARMRWLTLTFPFLGRTFPPD